LVHSRKKQSKEEVTRNIDALRNKRYQAMLAKMKQKLSSESIDSSKTQSEEEKLALQEKLKKA
jgi:hypothetical protein